jgi:hypothetical protein
VQRDLCHPAQDKTHRTDPSRGYAEQALDLTLGLGYVERLLANSHIAKYLAKHHAELLNEFTKLLREKVEEMSRTITRPAGRPPSRDIGNEEGRQVGMKDPGRTFRSLLKQSLIEAH